MNTPPPPVLATTTRALCLLMAFGAEQGLPSVEYVAPEHAGAFDRYLTITVQFPVPEDYMLREAMRQLASELVRLKARKVTEVRGGQWDDVWYSLRDPRTGFCLSSRLHGRLLEFTVLFQAE